MPISSLVEKTVSQQWFGPKRIGYGAGPRSWQGWTATGVYIVLMLAVPRLVVHFYAVDGKHLTPDGRHLMLGLIAFLTIGFLLLVWKKYEPDSE